MQPRLRITLALLSVATLTTGCLTRWLWSRDEGPPPLYTVEVPCVVHSVKERPAEGRRPAQLVLDFAAADVRDAPQHLRGAAPGQPTPGVLVLQAPPYDGGDWRSLPGAERFAPESFELRVTRGDYFRQRGANARVAFHGTLPREQVGRVLTAEDSRTAWAQWDALPLEPLQYGLLRRCIEGFRARNWERLLATDDRRAQPTAIAWLGPDGRRVSTDHVRELLGDLGPAPPSPEAADCSLLVRLDSPYGSQRYARIPLPSLIHGEDLAFERDGDTVHWTREQIWDGHLAPAGRRLAHLADYPVPLRNQMFVYRWSSEVKRSRILETLFKGLLTPITAVTDFVVMTNPHLVKLGEMIGAIAVRTFELILSGGK